MLKSKASSYEYHTANDRGNAVTHHLAKDGTVTEDKSNGEPRTHSLWSSQRTYHFVPVFRTLTQILIMAYLSFLWFGDRSGIIWRKIVLENRVAISVASCSLVTRWIVAVQASFAAAILASKLLEAEVPLRAIPQIATIKFSNSGPVDIIFAYWKDSTLLRIDVVAATIALFITVVLLQFTSTMLVFDLLPGTIESFTNHTTFAIALNADLDDKRIGYVSPFWPQHLVSANAEFPVYAQVSGIPITIDGLYDTGPSIRALLPIPTVQCRSNLLSFQGDATLWDARIMYVRPYVENSKLYTDYDVREPANFYITAVGDFSPAVVKSPMVWNSNERLRLYCNLPAEFLSSTKAYRLSNYVLCVVTRSRGIRYPNLPEGGLLSSLDTIYDPMHSLNMVQSSSNDNSWNGPYEEPPISLSYLIVNITDLNLPVGWFQRDALQVG